MTCFGNYNIAITAKMLIIDTILSTTPRDTIMRMVNGRYAKTIALGGVDIGNINAAEAAKVTGTHISSNGAPTCIAMAVTSGSSIAIEARFELISVIANVAIVRPATKVQIGK